MNVAIIQAPLQWEDPSYNRSFFERKLSFVQEQTDLVILPETFTTGFSMLSKNLAEKMEGASVSWMIEMAKEHQVHIAGSLIIQEGQQYFNRLLVVGPSGIEAIYDKRHLFTMAQENEHYTSGKERVIVDIKGWKILLQTCYDLRFPVFSRNQNDYDAVIYVANWPAVRSYPWTTLLRARAMENQCYVLACNRVGKDGNGIEYSGDSAILNPIGEECIDIPAFEEGVFYHCLDQELLEDCRTKFPVLNDGDLFEVKL
jgi:omega-amidase